MIVENIALKKLSCIVLLFIISLGFSQKNSHVILVKSNVDTKTFIVQHEVSYYNNSPDTLHKIFFYDWNNAFSDKNSALAKRFSDEFIRSFHLAPESERGYTKITNCLDEAYNQLKFSRPDGHPDILLVELNHPLEPFSFSKISFSYLLKIPSSKFTKYGFSDDKIYLKDWLLSPCKYVNKGFTWYSNENLDDKTSVPSDYSIVFEKTNNFEIASSLNVTEKNDNTILLEGENILETDIILTKEIEFISFKNEIIEVSTNLEPKRLEEYQQAIVIDRITRFVNDKLGASICSKIIVSQEDYDKQPFYGLNQLPAFLNPYPNDFMYEMKFLKTYLNNYLKSNLQLNPRKENWVYDGIQVFLMMQYVDAFHPKMKMTGNLANWKLLKSYNLINIDFNKQYNYLYLLMARKNLDQAVEVSKENLIKFNEKIAGKYRSGLNFKYLDSYLGNGIVEQSLKEFLHLNAACYSSKYELEYILKKNTTKNIDWFFETLVNSRELIDFRFGKVKKNKDEITVNIINKTRTNVPISFYQLKKDSVVNKEWIENIKTDTTITFARNNADKITLNYFNEIPEYNLRNNWKSLKGFFFNNRPIKFNFLRDLEDPYYNQIFYVPEFEYNLYDGLALGVSLNNKSLLNKPFIFKVTPFYATNSQSIVGKASFLYEKNFRGTGPLYKIRYSINGSQFHYAENAKFTNFSPIVQFYFRDPNFRVNKNEYILLRQLYVNREKTNAFALDKNSENYNVFNAKYANFQSEGVKHYSILTDLQLANSFGKLSAEIYYRKLFENNRQISIRFFAGTFLYRSTNSDFFSFGLDRPTDYMFDQNLLGRSETTGLYSQQYVYAEGGFKSIFDTRFANQWMLTSNVAFNVWNWIQVYGDFGAFKNHHANTRFVYDSGIHLNLVPDYFELFFPVYSSNGFEMNNPNYGQRIRFVVTLSPKLLVSLFTRRWF